MSWSDLNLSSPELFICCSTVLLNFWRTLHLGPFSLGGDSRHVHLWYKLTELFAQISVFSFPEEVPKWHLTYSGVCAWCQVQELLLYFAIPGCELPLHSPLLPRRWLLPSPLVARVTGFPWCRCSLLAPCHPSPGGRPEFSLSLAQWGLLAALLPAQAAFLPSEQTCFSSC